MRMRSASRTLAWVMCDFRRGGLVGRPFQAVLNRFLHLVGLERPSYGETLFARMAYESQAVATPRRGCLPRD